MQSVLNKSDIELKNDVLAELKYDPGVKFTDIGVLAKDGAVTLTGRVGSYAEKWAAVSAAKNVEGLCAIADDIEVVLPNYLHHTDSDIAAAANHQLKWSTVLPEGSVQVKVQQGWVTLEGQVEWWYQKNVAENLMKHLAGVKGITTLIAIKPKVQPDDVEMAIKSAFGRHALLDAGKVHVSAIGSKVVLRGEVRNYTEREEAERVAWAAPGVSSVDNKLIVSWI